MGWEGTTQAAQAGLLRWQFSFQVLFTRFLEFPHENIGNGSAKNEEIERIWSLGPNQALLLLPHVYVTLECDWDLCGAKEYMYRTGCVAPIICNILTIHVTYGAPIKEQGSWAYHLGDQDDDTPDIKFQLFLKHLHTSEFLQDTLSLQVSLCLKRSNEKKYL